MSHSKTGEKHPGWKGGKYTNYAGYMYIYKPTHPFATKTGYVREHRLVMEAFVGRYLTETEVIHHKNHNKKDNRIENLILFETHAKHLTYEYKNKERG